MEGPDRIVDGVADHWEGVVEDMEATAEQYREQGWEAIELHPGDVATPADEPGRTGIDVLVPDTEFLAVADAVDAGATFTDTEVFRATASGIVFLVAAVEAPDAETVVLVPSYYDPEQSREFLEMIEREGEVRTHVRPLDRHRIVTFTHDDPAPFTPPE